jgi:hypothetical protein
MFEDDGISGDIWGGFPYTAIPLYPAQKMGPITVNNTAAFGYPNRDARRIIGKVFDQ